jgi:HlyD family secretion protein
VKDQLFRKAALQSLDVAERLDTAVQVVSPATSLAVLSAAALIVAALIWAFAGRVPTRVYGEGLLLREGSIVDVTSMADGQIGRMMVNVGDVVTENDPIARIEQPELEKQRTLLDAKLQELTARYAALERLDREGAALKHSVFARQRLAVHYALEETSKQVAFYQEKLKDDTALLEKGLTTPAAVAETRQKVLELRDAIYNKNAESRNIAFNALETHRTLEARKFDLSMQVSETKREIEELQKRIETQSVVLAKAAGRVIEIKLTEGDAVARGRAIATLEVVPADHTNLIADLYIPAQDGKRVKPGMAIRLSPTVVKPEEEGYLEGIVDSVSPFPVSEQSMLRSVRNQNIVRQLAKDGPVYEARVRVIADPRTPSGLRWSNGRGPAMTIASGTPVHGLVTVRTRRPIALIIPAIERLVTDVPDDHGR